jgi:hypothetical protein
MELSITEMALIVIAVDCTIITFLLSMAIGKYMAKD